MDSSTDLIVSPDQLHSQNAAPSIVSATEILDLALTVPVWHQGLFAPLPIALLTEDSSWHEGSEGQAPRAMGSPEAIVRPNPDTAVLSRTSSLELSSRLRLIERFVHRSKAQRHQDGMGKKKAKRPLNAFMLYRMAFRDIAERLCATKSQQLVSQICGRSWAQEDEDLRDQFHEWALADKRNHMRAWQTTKA